MSRAAAETKPKCPSRSLKASFSNVSARRSSGHSARLAAAVIVVERESHKGMMIGAGGQRLKKIGQSARLEMEQLFESRIFLELTVKVEKNWTHDPRKIEELGF
jgi:GTP-binding protein Era